MARRETKPARGEEAGRNGKSGGLFLGLVIGLVMGLVVAAALAWHFNKGSVFKPVEQAPAVTAASAPPEHAGSPAEAVAPAEPVAQPHPAAKPAEASAVPHKSMPPKAPHKIVAAEEPPARVPLTFYGILPGDKPAKPVEPPKSTEIWWLQIVALKNPADADRLKAKLSLLGLSVSTQKVETAGQSLYRVRVGPYKRDEDAFADLDTLSANNYEPRLLKEPVKGIAP